MTTNQKYFKIKHGLEFEDGTSMTTAGGGGSFTGFSELSRNTLTTSTESTSTLVIVTDSDVDPCSTATTMVSGMPAFYDRTNGLWSYITNLFPVTADETSPPSPGAWANVLSFFKFNNAVTDEKGLATLSAPAYSSSIVKFGTHSLDVTSGIAYWSHDSTSDIGTGDFCIEAFVYYTGGSSYNRAVIQFDSYLVFGIGIPTAVAWRFDGTNFDQTTATVPMNEWVHIAYIRDGGNFYIAINGTRELIRSSDTKSVGNASAGKIGEDVYGDRWYGYVDSLRISKEAVYTADFTPTTTDFATS